MVLPQIQCMTRVALGTKYIEGWYAIVGSSFALKIIVAARHCSTTNVTVKKWASH